MQMGRLLSTFRRVLVIGVCLQLVASCGDDGGGNNPQENKAPVASAGQNQDVTVGEKVVVDGSASSDPDGDSLTFDWSFVSRPEQSTAALDDTKDKKPSFTADLAGEYEVSLVVSDGKLKSAASTITITASEADALVANAGDDSEITVGLEVELDGSKSTAPAGSTLTYTWSIESKPEDSTAALDDLTAEKPKFTADKVGEYKIALAVSDGTEDSDPATVTITAVERTKPVANAGDDQSVTAGDTVELDGSKSTGSPGLALTYEWSMESKPEESAAALDDPTAEKPKFTADKAGDYQITLVVNDGTEDSSLATITVTAIAAAQ